MGLKFNPLILNGFDFTSSGGGGGGTVTSVGLADGSTVPIYTISNSPVIGSGTLTFTLNDQSVGLIFAGPSSGSPTEPTFRALVATDIPSLNYVTSVGSGQGLTGGPITSSGTLSLATIAGPGFLANSSSGFAVPVSTTLTSMLDAVLGVNQGAIIYRSSSIWTGLLPGTSGQFLQTQGTSANPQWASGNSGTVTSVSVVSANGFAGTIATATTTPAITLSTSITGLLKGNGTAISAATAGTDYVIPSGSITGTATNITATTNTTLTTLSSLSLPGSQVTGNISGNAANITATSNSTLTTLSSLSLPGSQVTGNISGSSGSVSGTNVITNSNLAQMPTLTIKGNNTGSTATPLDLTVAQVNAILPVFTSTLNGLVPFSGGGTVNFLRADGTWQPAGGGSSYTFADSIVNTSGTITLKNDSASPTASQYYGTNSGSTLGYYNLPTGFTNPMTTLGDMIYENATPTAARLPIGLTGQVLAVESGIPTWTTLGGNVAFAQYASSQVTTTASLSSSTFVTFSNSPAFTITPTITGIYKVYSSIPFDNGGSGGQAVSRIFNTSGNATLLYESQGVVFGPTAEIVDSCYIQSVYTLTAGTTYVFDIQAKQSGVSSCFLVGGEASFYMFAEGIGLTVQASGTNVGASVYLSTNIAVSANNPVIYDTKLFDSNNAYNTSTGLYTLPYAGYYQISGSNDTTGTSCGFYVQKNSTPLGYLLSGGAVTSGAVLISGNAGDTIQINADTSCTVGGNTGPYITRFDIVQIPAPSVVSGTGISRSINSISTATAAGSTTSTDYVYLVSGTTTLTLPTAVGNTNLYTVKNTDGNITSIATTSGQTIDGSTSPITITTQYTSLNFISNGINWDIV